MSKRVFWLTPNRLSHLSVLSTLNQQHVKKMRKQTQKLTLLLAAMLVMFSARAQYSGSVTDAGDKSTLPGAVIQAGSTATTMTDMDGKWSLDVPEGTEIKVSFVGYVSKKIVLGKEKNIKK